MKNVALFLGALLLGCSMPQGANVGPQTFRDLTGNVIDPLEVGDAKAAVLIFITTDCPIANGYAPEFRKILEDYRGKPVRFTFVHVDPGVTLKDARKHAADYGLPSCIVMDPIHQLVKATGATVTPEAAVLDASGELAYLGRINNQYPRLGDRRNNVTKHELRDSLDAVLAGRPVAVPRAKAIGCFMPDISPAR